MFLQTSSFSFHTRAAPIVFLTVVCQAAELTEIKNVGDCNLIDQCLLIWGRC